MPDETGIETDRSDASSDDDSPFADVAEDTAAAVAQAQVSAEETEQDGQDPEDTGGSEADGNATRDQEGVTKAGEPDVKGETDASGELKVVVSIKEGRATIGVQQPSSDPHIESFNDHDLPKLTQEVSAVVERAKAKWEESPKHPTYERPAPPARRPNRHQQGAAQEATAAAEIEQAQQQTLRLF